MTRGRGILPPRRRWTPEELERLRQLYPDTRTQELEAVFGRPLGKIYSAAGNHGLRKSAAYLASPAACRLRRGDQVGKATRYPPGHKPANQGLRRPGYAPGRMAETQFRPGERRGVAERNWCPLGTIRTDPEGYRRIKIREGRKGEAYGFGNTGIWPLLNRHVWEQGHGPIPAGHSVVFRDGDRTNVALDNLECIPRGELMRRNSSQRWGKQMFEVIQLRGALNRKIRSLEEKQDEKQDDGFAQPPL
jgi:HNH endonuclease